jgi:hypothetical protein
MLKEFQDAAEKAQKKETLNQVMLVVAGFFIALCLTLLTQIQIS